jgi:hypothetical protein
MAVIRQPTALHNGSAAPLEKCCPVCQKDDRMQKAAAEVRQGISCVWLPDGTESHRQVSGLAESLSPPPLPVGYSFGQAVGAVATSYGVGLLLILSIYALTRQSLFMLPDSMLSTGRVVAISWFGLLVPTVAIARAGTQQHRVRLLMPRWQAATQRWNNLYYCERDDVVFSPDDAACLPPERMNEILRFNEGAIPSDARGVTGGLLGLGFVGIILSMSIAYVIAPDTSEDGAALGQTISIPAQAPSELQSESLTPGSVHLTWTNNLAGAWFCVDLAGSSEDLYALAGTWRNYSCGTTETAVEVADLECGKLYYWRVFAVAGEDYAHSAESTFSTQACP